MNNNTHPHSQIINEWLKDTTQTIQMEAKDDIWIDVSIGHLINSCGVFKFIVKPKEVTNDGFSALRAAQASGKTIAAVTRYSTHTHFRVLPLINFDEIAKDGVFSPSHYVIVDDEDVRVRVLEGVFGSESITVKFVRDRINGEVLVSII